VWRERHDGEKLREKTIEFIKRAHAGQVDKAGQPYHLHPMAVAELLPPDSDEDEYLAALLHDVLEDTEITETDLCDLGYSEKTIGIVKLLTRPAGVSYLDWIRQIAASGNEGAIRVKLADNIHNSDPDRLAQLPPEQRSIAKRYERSIRIMRDAL
jgi:(p)ppGpp synthase/HD superfamily hydrolase